MRRLAVNISDQNSILDFAKEYRKMTCNILNTPNFSEKNPEIAFHFASNSKAFQLMADIKKNTIIPIGNDSNWTNKNIFEQKLRILNIQKNEAKRNNDFHLVDSLTVIEKDLLIDLIVVNYRLMKSQDNKYQYFEGEDIVQLTTRNVGQHHLLVDIFQTDSLSFVFSINSSGLSCNTINNVEKLNQIANQFYRDIKTGGNFNKSGSNLSNILLKPISDKLINCSEITFIPDNILCQIPFEALPNPNTGNLLIKSHTISYHYSTSLWNKSAIKQNQNLPSILAIAPIFENTTTTIQKAFREQHAEDDYLYKLSTNDIQHLPFSGIETIEISKLFQSKGFSNSLLINKEATKEHFLSLSTQFTIIHIATHGHVSKISPNNSGFFLYTSENTNATGNSIGFVNMNEIYSLETNADLVVLSSCNSGVGLIYEGEGLMAIPRGFIYAGVPNVIASLWKVHDEKTKELMLFFYQHLLSGNSYAEALRNAKLDCITKGYLPLNWASFVIIGR